MSPSSDFDLPAGEPDGGWVEVWMEAGWRLDGEVCARLDSWLPHSSDGDRGFLTPATGGRRERRSRAEQRRPPDRTTSPHHHTTTTTSPVPLRRLAVFRTSAETGLLRPSVYRYRKANDLGRSCVVRRRRRRTQSPPGGCPIPRFSGRQPGSRLQVPLPRRPHAIHPWPCTGTGHAAF